MPVEPLLEVLSGANVSVGAAPSDDVHLIHNIGLSTSPIHWTLANTNPAVTAVLCDVFSLMFYIMTSDDIIHVRKAAV